MLTIAPLHDVAKVLLCDYMDKDSPQAEFSSHMVCQVVLFRFTVTGGKPASKTPPRGGTDNDFIFVCRGIYSHTCTS